MNRLPHRVSSALAAFALSAPLACAGPPSGERIAPRGVQSRVMLVLPFNVAVDMPPALKSRSEIVWRELERYLRLQGKQLKTVSWKAARALWLRSVRKVGSAGAGGGAGDTAARAFARDLRSRAEFDTMVAASLFVREAPISIRSARWDGVEREVEIEAHGNAIRRVAAAPLEGAAPAASIHVVVLDARGDKLHEASGGLELIVRIHAATREPSGVPIFHFATRTDLFADREHVREGIVTAFGPFLPPLGE